MHHQPNRQFHFSRSRLNIYFPQKGQRNVQLKKNKGNIYYGYSDTNNIMQYCGSIIRIQYNSGFDKIRTLLYSKCILYSTLSIYKIKVTFYCIRNAHLIIVKAFFIVAYILIFIYEHYNYNSFYLWTYVLFQDLSINLPNNNRFAIIIKLIGTSDILILKWWLWTLKISWRSK